MSAPALWTKHRPVAYNVASSFDIRGMDADDVRQEALIALWQASRSHAPELGPFRPWAIRVITAHLNDCLKAAMRQKRAATIVELTDVHAAPERSRQLQDVLDLLPSLTPLERQVVAAKLNGTYDHSDKRQDNALVRARAKLRPAA